MARLTNLQLELLSGEITEQLAELDQKKRVEIEESEEYKNFIDNIVKEDKNLSVIQAAYDEVKKAREKLEKEENNLQEAKNLLKFHLRNKIPAMKDKDFRWQGPEKMFENHLKELRKEKFNLPYFNRDKVNRKVQAQILLGDMSDAKEIYKSMLEKFSGENMPDLSN